MKKDYRILRRARPNGKVTYWIQKYHGFILGWQGPWDYENMLDTLDEAQDRIDDLRKGARYETKRDIIDY